MLMAGMFQGFALFTFLIAAMFWIFVLWMFWKIVQALVGIDQTLKDIANSLRDRPEKL